MQNPEEELARFEKAKEEAVKQLQKLYDKACKEVGEANAAIFEIHQMMLDDEDYTDSVHNIIASQQVNAEYAVGVTADNFANMFAAMDDEYMKARSSRCKRYFRTPRFYLKGQWKWRTEHRRTGHCYCRRLGSLRDSTAR